MFYADRLIRLVVEHGLGCLPFSEVTVQTPTGADYNGVAFSNRLCGVSVIRSGESMENALRACCKGVKIGKILIRRERDMGPCRIMYEKLPLDISRRYVLLLDPILASGASSVAAIDLLLSKGVAEERIIFLTLIAAPPGIKAICESYPKLTVVTTEIDNSLSPTHVVLPGIGEFGDRYFGSACLLCDAGLCAQRRTSDPAPRTPTADSISCDRPGEVSYASTTPCDSAAASAARARLLAREALNREAMELAAQNGTNTPEANANGARTSTTGDLVGR